MFTISSDSTTNTLVVQYSLISSDNLQQTATINNISLSDGGFHHIGVAVHDIWLSVIIDGVIKLRRELASSAATEADNIYVGTLNQDEQPTLQGSIYLCILKIKDEVEIQAIKSNETISEC